MKLKFFLNTWITAALAVPTAVFSQPVTLTKVTVGDIATNTGGFASFAWGDFRNSGLLDLVVANNGPLSGGGGTNLFYRNNGDGTFLKILQQDPAADPDYHVGVAVGDFDNDGTLDLTVASGVNSPSTRRIMLYQGKGDGTFTRTSGGSVTNQLGYFEACSWIDYDNDGFLDLCVNDLGSGQLLLFHGNGDGTFTKITSGAIVTDAIFGTAIWGDYDNDGFMDLLVPTGLNNGVNYLYHNNGNGTFTRILTNSIATDRWSAGTDGAAWGDYDNDGFLDLFVTCEAGTPNRLYHNNGDGTFTSISNGPTAYRPPGSNSKACDWGDYDNDGYLDLFVTSYNGPNMLFHNNGDGTFTQILTGDPVTENNTGLYCNACSWVDYDNDGFLDLFVARAPAASNLLYHNGGNTNGWLEVKLVGTVGNRSGIGAKVRVRATIGGKTFWQVREISNGGARWVQPLVAHFGLGDSTNVDTLRIEWPSKTVQEFHNITPRQILTITEPSQLQVSVTNGVPQFSLHGGHGLEYDIQSSDDLASWSDIGTILITNSSGIAPLIDTNSTGSTRFYRALLH
jgi:hypothetical protein